MNELAALEAVLFVTESPVPASELAEVLEVSTRHVEDLLGQLGEEMEARGSGLVLRPVAGGWRLYSHPDAYAHLERFATLATARK
ncbi:MAG: SMC-Scp complex subunit ScpB, partial [Actinobacteria bacterium]|nr:SMC-Scp complex subunit ScpB [Actinomycetota bacterium]